MAIYASENSEIIEFPLIYIRLEFFLPIYFDWYLLVNILPPCRSMCPFFYICFDTLRMLSFSSPKGPKDRRRGERGLENEVSEILSVVMCCIRIAIPNEKNDHYNIYVEGKT